jgi:hypothetical protein
MMVKIAGNRRAEAIAPNGRADRHARNHCPLQGNY